MGLLTHGIFYTWFQEPTTKVRCSFIGVDNATPSCPLMVTETVIVSFHATTESRTIRAVNVEV